MLALIGAGCGALGGAGVGAGLSAAEAASRSRRTASLVLGAAVGGGLAGTLAQWLGRWSLAALVGMHLDIGGSLEGVIIGAAAGLGYGLATSGTEGGLAALTRLRSYVQERMGQLSRMNGGGARTYIEEGRPYQEIVKLATTLEADLIVIGTAVHGSLFGNSQVLGSEIERVIRHAPCPVLCVPAARAVTPLPALVTQVVPQT